MSLDFWNKVKRKPPAVMFGLRLVVVPNKKIPKDSLVFAVHPENHAQIMDKINDAFGEWIKKPQPE